MAINGHGHRTFFTYNANHDVASYRDATGRISTYIHDSRHNLLSMTDPFGDTTTYAYNAFDQVTLATNPGGENTEYRYDAAGNLIRVIDFAGVTRYLATYNAFGKPLTETLADGRTTTRGYDARGNVVSLAEAGLPTITRTTSPLGRTQSFTDVWGETQTFAHDALGRLTGMPYGSGTAAMTQDLEGRLTSTETTLGGRTERSAATYTSFGPTSLVVNGSSVEAATPRFASVPPPPLAACTPTCALRCGTRIGDTCGGLIDCTCGAGLTCNAGVCVQ